MKRNEGKTDRTVRIALGAVVLILGLFLNSWWGLIGLIPLFTGLAGWCPIYALFKWSTYHPQPAGHAGTGAF